MAVLTPLTFMPLLPAVGPPVRVVALMEALQLHHKGGQPLEGLRSLRVLALVRMQLEACPPVDLLHLLELSTWVHPERVVGADRAEHPLDDSRRHAAHGEVVGNEYGNEYGRETC